MAGEEKIVRERIKNNWSAKLVALGLASLLWLYVNTQANPLMEDVHSNIPVEITGLAPDLTLITRPPAVQVRVAGVRTGLAALSSRDIRAYIDLSGAAPGSNLIPVNVVVQGKVEVVSIVPAQVNVTVDRIVEEKREVKAKVIGQLAEGFAHGEPKIRPDFVLVQGASRVLSDISEVFVTIELSQEMQEDLGRQLPVEVVSRTNMPLTASVRLSPQWVEVVMPVEEQPASKIVPVIVLLQGKAAPGLEVSEIAVQPEAVAIRGPAEVLQKIDHVSAGEINVAGITETLIVEQKLLLPELVEGAEVDKVLVTIKVGEAN
jgi:YbbR domain-containing protein